MTNMENIFFNPRDLKHCGKHVILGKTVRIRKPERVSIGDHTIIDDFTYVSCGLTVGSYTHIGALTAIIGGNAHVTVGSYVNIAPGGRLVAASHDFLLGGLSGPTIPPEIAEPGIEENVVLEDHVLLGANTTILPGVHLPEGFATGASTLVTPNTKLKPWSVYLGSPAQFYKPRNRDKILDSVSMLSRHKPDPKD
jgi:acetyltransferase-like isoleucine patch superfamily enzyme